MIQLVRQKNPVACALMAKMNMRAEDRPKVKAQCLRLLASLKLDPARTTLIGGFIESYLSLSAQEMQQYEREVAQFAPVERNEKMETMTSWHRQGREGLHDGKDTLVLRLLQRRFGVLLGAITARPDQFSPDQLDDLGKALLDFGAYPT